MVQPPARAPAPRTPGSGVWSKCYRGSRNVPHPPAASDDYLLRGWLRFPWRWCLRTICFCCSSLILYAFQNTGCKSRHSAWSIFFWLRRSSEWHDMWWWSCEQNILIKMCIKNVCHKKIVSNIPVLVSVCLMRLVYWTNYCVSQNKCAKIMAIWSWKC